MITIIRLKLRKLFKQDKKVKILFTKPPLAKYRLAYHPGETGEFEIDKAIELITAGVAILVRGKENSSTAYVLKRLGKSSTPPTAID